MFACRRMMAFGAAPQIAKTHRVAQLKTCAQHACNSHICTHLVHHSSACGLRKHTSNLLTGGFATSSLR